MILFYSDTIKFMLNKINYFWIVIISDNLTETIIVTTDHQQRTDSLATETEEEAAPAVDIPEDIPAIAAEDNSTIPPEKSSYIMDSTDFKKRSQEMTEYITEYLQVCDHFNWYVLR